MNRAGPRIGVGNLRFEGCDGCRLSGFVRDYVGKDPVSEDLTRSSAIWDLSHLAIAINGTKRPGDLINLPHEVDGVTLEEKRHVLGIATSIGVPMERADEFLDLFVECVYCPMPVDGTYDTFRIEDGKAIEII